MLHADHPEILVGVDIGGTFTDFVVYSPTDGKLETFKLLSTPHDPAEAVLRGLSRLRIRHGLTAAANNLRIRHGSTVATNALLERKGAPTALIATRGFGDLLQIGRQNRPELYDFFADPPPALAPPERCFEVGERVNAAGQVEQPLDPREIEALLPRLEASGATSAAVCLLFSFLRPEHEQAIAARLREAGYFVSVSSEILPEYREYERASTTAVNAYVSPALDGYLSRLEHGAGAAELRVMQSNGGVISLDEARRAGVRCILSGPAGGVIGAQRLGGLALAAGTELRLLTFDMGGTSTDVSLIAGRPQLTTEAIVGGCPIHIPMLDIHTIGAGGGSLASVDPGGALRVGPQSAGADPGPACYGRGERATVTDANLALGRLAGEHFLGGEMPLDAGRAQRALARLGADAGLDPIQAALGVVEVAEAHMERALRVISVERGHDPADFTLLSFGGAGGLHAAGLARRLGIPRLLVPPLASTLSAFGMLAAEVVKDYSRTVMLPGGTPFAELHSRLDALAEQGRRELLGEGVAPAEQRLEPSLDMRYAGQSYELNVPFDEGFLAAFHAAHRQAYGYDRPDAPVEIVTLRVRAVGRVQPPALPILAPGETDPAAALIERRPVVLPGGETVRAPFYRGESLRPGNVLHGPALVVRADTTVLLGAGDRAEVDGYGNLVVAVG